MIVSFGKKPNTLNKTYLQSSAFQDHECALD